jgi:hypothetical protein
VGKVAEWYRKRKEPPLGADFSTCRFCGARLKHDALDCWSCHRTWVGFTAANQPDDSSLPITDVGVPPAL